jgi:hypothetical protein
MFTSIQPHLFQFPFHLFFFIVLVDRFIITFSRYGRNALFLRNADQTTIMP